MNKKVLCWILSITMMLNALVPGLVLSEGEIPNVDVIVLELEKPVITEEAVADGTGEAAGEQTDGEKLPDMIVEIVLDQGEALPQDNDPATENTEIAEDPQPEQPEQIEEIVEEQNNDSEELDINWLLGEENVTSETFNELEIEEIIEEPVEEEPIVEEIVEEEPIVEEIVEDPEEDLIVEEIIEDSEEEPVEEEVVEQPEEELIVEEIVEQPEEELIVEDSEEEPIEEEVIEKEIIDGGVPMLFSVTNDRGSEEDADTEEDTDSEEGAEVPMLFGVATVAEDEDSIVDDSEEDPIVEPDVEDPELETDPEQEMAPCSHCDHVKAEGRPCRCQNGKNKEGLCDYCWCFDEMHFSCEHCEHVREKNQVCNCVNGLNAEALCENCLNCDDREWFPCEHCDHVRENGQECTCVDGKNAEGNCEACWYCDDLEWIECIHCDHVREKDLECTCVDGMNAEGVCENCWNCDDREWFPCEHCDHVREKDLECTCVDGMNAEGNCENCWNCDDTDPDICPLCGHKCRYCKCEEGAEGDNCGCSYCALLTDRPDQSSQINVYLGGYQDVFDPETGEWKTSAILGQGPVADPSENYDDYACVRDENGVFHLTYQLTSDADDDDENNQTITIDLTYALSLLVAYAAQYESANGIPERDQAYVHEPGDGRVFTIDLVFGDTKHTYVYDDGSFVLTTADLDQQKPDPTTTPGTSSGLKVAFDGQDISNRQDLSGQESFNFGVYSEPIAALLNSIPFSQPYYNNTIKDDKVLSDYNMKYHWSVDFDERITTIVDMDLYKSSGGKQGTEVKTREEILLDYLQERYGREDDENFDVVTGFERYLLEYYSNKFGENYTDLKTLIATNPIVSDELVTGTMASLAQGQSKYTYELGSTIKYDSFFNGMFSFVYGDPEDVSGEGAIAEMKDPILVPGESKFVADDGDDSVVTVGDYYGWPVWLYEGQPVSYLFVKTENGYKRLYAEDVEKYMNDPTTEWYIQQGNNYYIGVNKQETPDYLRYEYVDPNWETNLAKAAEQAMEYARANNLSFTVGSYMQGASSQAWQMVNSYFNALTAGGVGANEASWISFQMAMNIDALRAGNMYQNTRWGWNNTFQLKRVDGDIEIEKVDDNGNTINGTKADGTPNETAFNIWYYTDDNKDGVYDDQNDTKYYLMTDPNNNNALGFVKYNPGQSSMNYTINTTNGVIDIDYLMLKNMVYYMQEAAAPEGYVKDTTVYIICDDATQYAKAQSMLQDMAIAEIKNNVASFLHLGSVDTTKNTNLKVQNVKIVTPTPVPTPTPTPTYPPKKPTPTPTATVTPTPTPTPTPTATPTNPPKTTPTPVPTNTPAPTKTPTVAATPTPTPVPTATPLIPTVTPTVTPEPEVPGVPIVTIEEPRVPLAGAINLNEGDCFN